MNRRWRVSLAAALGLWLAGCASDDYYGSPGSVSTHTSFYYGSGWYDYPYYYYDDPDYIVTPPDRPIDPGARPENPIANVPPAEGAKPGQLPSPRPDDGPSASPRTPTQKSSTTSRSRMPSAQPRSSTSRARPSIPSQPRGGGMSRGGGRRR
jgi:hypothetical protein